MKSWTKFEVRRLAAACGVSRFIEKPYEPDGMLSPIAEATRERGAALPPAATGFEAEHLAVLDEKVVQQVSELEHANGRRNGLFALLMQAQEDERRRIADGVHDDSIQAILAVSLRLELLERRASTAAETAAFRTLRESVNFAVERLRSLIFELRPRQLDERGLSAALRSYIESVHGDPIPIDLSGDEVGREDVPYEMGVLLFSSAKEILANARTHSGAVEIGVETGRRAGGVFVRVTDDGRGFHPRTARRPRAGHIGLAGIAERLEAVGGSLDIVSAPGEEGSRVEVWIPGVTGVPDELADTSES